MRRGGVGGFTRDNAKKGYEAANWSKELLAENGRKTLRKISKEKLSEGGRIAGLKNRGKKRTKEQKAIQSERVKEWWRNKRGM